MNELILSGSLNLMGNLNLAAPNGGKIKVGADEVLVEVDLSTGDVQGKGIPVIQPPPPASPIDTGTKVKVVKSFNSWIKANGKNIVALGICLQGGEPPPLKWPGMVLPSTKNTQVVRINGVAINVKGDSGITLPNGGSVTFDQASGQ